ncbi:universal stress protein [Streptomyces cinerochromogenes]|uniref:Universal stress protein n=1 Tax=Streptomyces cinerochromogenes TaxID=66422 RepID=A0ABW7BEH0_9ACTN
MELPLVVGVDGSEPSMRATDWAADEAVLRGVPLRLVHASLWERYEGTSLAQDLAEPAEQVMAEDIVRAAARRARTRHPDLEVSAEVLPEEPESALVREGQYASLLVLGTRGRGGIAELLLGSVSLTVAAYAPCPVVVLRGSHDNQAVPGTRGRMVVGVGDAPQESAAVRFAYEEARRRGVPLEAVRAWRCPVREAVGESDDPYGVKSAEEKSAQTLRAVLADAPEGLELHPHTVEGPAHKVLLGASCDADLLVVGSRRSPGALGLQLGRVAHSVLHHAACPVVVVPQPM